LQAELNGSSPYLKLRTAKEALKLKNSRIKAAFQVDKNSVSLSLTELALDYPGLNLSADLALTQSTPSLSLQVKGSQIDVAATRQVALELSGKNDVVKDIFDIVKGGSVPLITLKARGNSLSDLGKTDNMVIHGQMRNGEIYIPDARLDLKDVAGEVVISRGILQGENLRARLGNSLGQNGKLKLGLIGDAAPFHLEVDVQADLSQLPPILKGLVDYKNFPKELKKAVLCGISTPGTLKVSASNIGFDLEAIAKDQELNSAKTCLVGEIFKADGTYSLKGRFQGRGKAEDLLKTATGQVEMKAEKGRIYHDIILLSVLKFLNLIEFSEGRANAKDMGKKGFGYHSFRIKAKLQDGKLRYEEAVLHGQPMTVTAAGEHNLQNGRLDFTLLVAPQVTLDRIFEDIPLIGPILDTLDTIPLSVKGTFGNIHLIKYLDHPVLDAIGWIFIVLGGIFFIWGIQRYRQVRKVLREVTPEDQQSAEKEMGL